jgi:hypothetical protein
MVLTLLFGKEFGLISGSFNFCPWNLGIGQPIANLGTNFDLELNESRDSSNEGRQTIHGRRNISHKA